MKALTIHPGQKDSASVQNVPEPPAIEGAVLVRGLELGICGTDFELTSGEYGWAPPGSNYLILGHESLGRVEEAPAGTGFNKGDLVVGIVRHPDPEPCLACAVGQWDMCRNGKYTEHGIKERHGFGSEWWRIEPEFAVKLDNSLRDVGVLMEPTTVLAKAWDEIEHIGRRAEWKPKTLLITGAGPIGLIGALLGAQRGLEVHVLDRVQDGPKPDLVKQLGAHYHTGPLNKIGFLPDVTIECTGVASVIIEAMQNLGNYGILCLAGVSSKGQDDCFDMGAINYKMVLENRVVFGSVNARLSHYKLAQEALLKADRAWLSKLISRRETLDSWAQALKRHPDDIKVIIDIENS